MSVTIDSYKKLTSNIGYFSDSTNIGILELKDSIAVIDTGSTSQDGKSIVETLALLFPTKPVSLIINTHAHSDHCGGNPYIVKNTSCKVWTSLNESKLMNFTELQGYLRWGAMPFEQLEKSFFSMEENCKTDRILTEETIDLDNLSIQTFYLPGHNFDQIGILAKDKTDNKTVFFLGDAFFGITVLKKYWIPFMFNPALFRESVHKIENIISDYYLPSHGELFFYDNLHEKAEMNIIITYELESLILRVLKDSPQTPEQILKKAADFTGLKLRMGQYILIGSTIRSYLSYLLNEGKVTFEVTDNQMLWSIRK